MFNTKFDVLTKLGVSRRFQPAIYTFVDEESESEVQNIEILKENHKILISYFYLCLSPIRGLYSPTKPLNPTHSHWNSRCFTNP